MMEIKALFSFWYLVQHAAGNPGGTKTAIHAHAAHSIIVSNKKKTIHVGKCCVRTVIFE
jgi:hypothetical protein